VFQGLATSEMAALGATALPLLVVQHPLGGEKPEAVSRRALQAVEQLTSLLGVRRPTPVPDSRPRVVRPVWA